MHAWAVKCSADASNIREFYSDFTMLPQVFIHAADIDWQLVSAAVFVKLVNIFLWPTWMLCWHNWFGSGSLSEFRMDVVDFAASPAKTLHAMTDPSQHFVISVTYTCFIIRASGGYAWACSWHACACKFVYNLNTKMKPEHPMPGI